MNGSIAPLIAELTECLSLIHLDKNEMQNGEISVQRRGDNGNDQGMLILKEIKTNTATDDKEERRRREALRLLEKISSLRDSVDEHAPLKDSDWSTCCALLIDQVVDKDEFALSEEQLTVLVLPFFSSPAVPGLAVIRTLVSALRRPSHRKLSRGAVAFIADRVCGNIDTMHSLLTSALTQLSLLGDARAADDLLRSVANFPTLLADQLRGIMPEQCFPDPFLRTIASIIFNWLKTTPRAKELKLTPPPISIEIVGRLIYRFSVFGQLSAAVELILWPLIVDGAVFSSEVLPRLLLAVPSQAASHTALVKLFQFYASPRGNETTDVVSPVDFVDRLLAAPGVCCQCQCSDAEVCVATRNQLAPLFAQRILLNDSGFAIEWPPSSAGWMKNGRRNEHRPAPACNQRYCLPLLRVLVARLVAGQLSSPYDPVSICLTVAHEWSLKRSVQGRSDEEHDWLTKCLYYLIDEIDSNDSLWKSYRARATSVAEEDDLEDDAEELAKHRRVFWERLMNTVTGAMRFYLNSQLLARRVMAMKIAERVSAALSRLQEGLPTLKFDDDCLPENASQPAELYSLQEAVLVLEQHHRQQSRESAEGDECGEEARVVKSPVGRPQVATLTVPEETAALWKRDFNDDDDNDDDEFKPLSSADQLPRLIVPGEKKEGRRNDDDDGSGSISDGDNDDGHHEEGQIEGHAVSEFGVAGAMALQRRKGRQPMFHLRDCLTALATPTSKLRPGRLRRSLIRTAELARVGGAGQDAESEEVARSLSSALLQLSDPFELDDFYSLRQDAMVALLCMAPETVVQYLTTAFYAPNHDLQQRAACLDVLRDGAQELATGRKSIVSDAELKQAAQAAARASLEPGQSIWLVEDDTAQSGNREQQRRDNESVTTRRWGYATEKYKSRASVRPTNSNRLSALAGHFLWPLLRRWDDASLRFDLLGDDAHLLAHMLSTMACILTAAGANRPRAIEEAKALADVAMACAQHAETTVRRAAAFTLTQCSQVLRNDDPGTINQLMSTASYDPDEQVRQLSSAALISIIK